MAHPRRTAHTAVLAVALGMLTTACLGRSAAPGSLGGEEMGEPAWAGRLLSRGSLLISGSAEVRPSSDGESMFVTVALQGPPSTTLALGWNLQRGLCGSPGVLMGRPGDYPAIVIHSDGSGASVASIDEPVPTAGSYSVRLFASPARGSQLLSCGDLSRR